MPRTSFSVAVIGAALALSVPLEQAAAAPGDLDPSFDEDGIFQQNLSDSGTASGAAAVLSLPDGRLISAG